MGVLFIPKTAPFGDEEIELLNRVVGPANDRQRAWLAGFLAGIESAAGPAQPVASPVAAEPLTIVFVTESGNSERLAGDLAKLARKSNLKPNVVDLADLDFHSLAKTRRLVVIASTWGQGDPPSRVAEKYDELMRGDFGRLDGVEYSVLSLGDSAYVEFCAIGKAIDARLEVLGARRVVERVDCDLDFEKPAADWIGHAMQALAPAGNGTGAVIAVDFAKAGATRTEIVEAEITEIINLNSSRSDKETVHLALSFENAVPPYEPGDSLDLHIENDLAEIDAVLTAAGLAHDTVLRDELRTRDIHTLSIKNIEVYATLTGRSDFKTLIESGDAKAWIEGRQLIDLLSFFPTALTAEHLRALTRPLAPRAYSIASSRRGVGSEAHLLISAVRYRAHDRDRKGVASNYIAERRKRGDKVRVRLRVNKHFRLPAPDRDIIMVGPGTGVAPFRAFVQERRATGAPGRNWLFFGDRTFTHDFLYQLEWQEAVKDGALTRIDVAFSRDQPEKIYVQHRIWEQRREVVAWLESGAFFYVCGDAKEMAGSVREAVAKAYADVKSATPEQAAEFVRQLERDKRYLTDTY